MATLYEIPIIGWFVRLVTGVLNLPLIIKNLYIYQDQIRAELSGLQATAHATVPRAEFDALVSGRLGVLASESEARHAEWQHTIAALRRDAETAQAARQRVSADLEKLGALQDAAYKLIKERIDNVRGEMEARSAGIDALRSRIEAVARSRMELAAELRELRAALQANEDNAQNETKALSASFEEDMRALRTLVWRAFTSAETPGWVALKRRNSAESADESAVCAVGREADGTDRGTEKDWGADPDEAEASQTDGDSNEVAEVAPMPEPIVQFGGRYRQLGAQIVARTHALERDARIQNSATAADASAAGADENRSAPARSNGTRAGSGVTPLSVSAAAHGAVSLAPDGGHRLAERVIYLEELLMALQEGASNAGDVGAPEPETVADPVAELGFLLSRAGASEVRVIGFEHAPLPRALFSLDHEPLEVSALSDDGNGDIASYMSVRRALAATPENAQAVVADATLAGLPGGQRRLALKLLGRRLGADAWVALQVEARADAFRAALDSLAADLAHEGFSIERCLQRRDSRSVLATGYVIASPAERGLRH